MLHPATVHFAMILPLVASLLGIYHLIKQEKITSNLSLVSLISATTAIVVVWATGNQAGTEIYNFLSTHGQEELKEHKVLGFYIMIASIVILVINLLSRFIDNRKVEILSIIGIFLLSVTIFLQGKHGGEIVYKYGQPFQVSSINDTITELKGTLEESEDTQEKLEALDDALDEIMLTNEEVSQITNK